MAGKKLKLSVPPDLAMTGTVEHFADLIIPHYQLQDPKVMNDRLRSVLNEAFVNVVRHSPASNRSSIEIVFEVDKPDLTILFPDDGPGFEVGGFMPPYPSRLFQEEFNITKTLDGEVCGRVENCDTVQIFFKESQIDKLDPSMLIEEAKDGGMGLSLIVKLMDEVFFIHDERMGNCLKISKRIKDV